MAGRAVNGPLVGREGLVAGLNEARAVAAQGQGQVALITGVAGIGKTRLVRELSWAVGSEMTVAWGCCDELDQSVPLAAMASLLRSAGIAPPLTPATGHLLDEAEVARVAARSLLSTAVNKPMMAIVEDLHWCDEASAVALRLVARSAGEVPIFVVLTARPDEAPPELMGLFAAIHRLPHAHEWPMGPLTVDETALLIAGAVGSTALPPRRLTERVHLITEGNPLFVEEVVGALGLAGTASFPDPGDVDRAPVPRTVQAAVWQRSRGLSDEGRRLLQVAAVAGRRADVNVLARVLGVDEPALIALLRQALATNLVVEDSPDHIAFRHELTRRAILEDLLARERRALHTVMADALEEDGAATPAELATHYWEAEQWEKARHYAAKAGHTALAMGAPQAAVDLLTKAIDAGQRLGLRPESDLLTARATAHDRLGQFEPANADLAARLDAARSRPDGQAECAALLDLGSLWTARDYGTAGDYFRRALDVARRIDRPGVLAVAQNRVGSWHLNSDRPEQARRLHREALSHYQFLGDEAGMASTFDLLGTADLTVGDIAGAARSYREAVSRFRARDDAPALASALAMQAFASPQYLGWPASWSSGNSAAEAEALAEESIAIHRRLGWRSGEALGHVALASVLGEAGRYREAFDHVGAASDLAAETEHAYWALVARLIGGVLHLDLLDALRSRQCLQEALDKATMVGSDYWGRIARGFLVDACLLAGDRGAARAVIEDVDDLDGAPRRSPASSATMGMRHLLRGRAELAIANGDHTKALEVVESLDVMIGATGPPSPRFLLLHGRALAAAGRRSEAEAIWREAIVHSERDGCIPAVWRAHAVLGRALRAQHRLDEADEHLHAARQHVARLAVANDRPGLETAAAALLPGPTARRRAKQAFGGLTAREQEVARLVAEGLTNPEIAGRLVVSPRTVEKHVEHVLTKLGLATRAQVATWAVRSHLIDGDQEELRRTEGRHS